MNKADLIKEISNRTGESATNVGIIINSFVEVL